MSKQYGSLTFMGQGQVKNFTPEKLVADPEGAGLWEGRFWTNTTDNAVRYYLNGEVKQVAEGGSLDDYLRRDGSLAMLGALLLDSDDQSAASDVTAISKGHFDTGLATKQNTITGAASTVVTSDLTAERVAIANAAGKLDVSAVTTTELGYVGGVTSPLQTQLDGKQADLGYTPVNRAGDSMSGQLAMNDNRIIGVGAPVNATDGARKIDIDNAIANLNWQDDVLAIQIDNTLDPSATPVTGDRYIITDSANLNANFGTIAGLGDDDIVEFDGTEFVVVFDISAQGANSAGTFVTNLADSHFYRYNTSWASFDGLDAIVAGVGLERSGNTFNVNMGAGIAQLPSDEVGIDVRANSGLFLTVDGATASTDTSAALAVLLQSAGGLGFGVDGGVQIASQGVTAAMLGAVAGNGINGGEGVALSVAAGDGIVVDGSGVSVDETFLDGLYARLDGADFTGAITVQAPTVDANPARKLDLDNLDTELSGAIGDVNTRISAGYFVYDGTAVAASTHTVTHGIGQKYVGVTVVDEFDNVVGVDEITFVDANSFTVDVIPASKIRVIAVGAAPLV
jgi:hypothetical protein